MVSSGPHVAPAIPLTASVTLTGRHLTKPLSAAWPLVHARIRAICRRARRMAPRQVLLRLAGGLFVRSRERISARPSSSTASIPTCRPSARRRRPLAATMTGMFVIAFVDA